MAFTQGVLEKCHPWRFSPRKGQIAVFTFPSFSITCRDRQWQHFPVPLGHLHF